MNNSKRIKAYIVLGLLNLSRCAAPEPERPSKAIQKKPNSQAPSTQTTNDSSSTSSTCRRLQEQFAAKTIAKGSAPVPILGNINFSLNIDAKVNLQAGDSQGHVGIDGKVLSATPGVAKPIAEKAIGAYRDPLQLEFVSLSDQSKLQGFEGLDCVVAAVRSIRNDKMEYRYDPPIPFIALPGTPSSTTFTKTFPNIKATVVRHFESVAKPGVYPGSVSLTNSGNSVKIQFNFGSRIPAMFATPVSSIEYVINNGNITAVNTKIFVAEGSTTELTLNKN